MLIFILIVLALALAAGIVMIFRGVSGATTLTWRDIKVEGQVGIVLAVAAMAATGYVYSQYEPAVEKENALLKEEATKLGADLKTAQGEAASAKKDAGDAKDKLNAANEALIAKSAEAQGFQSAAEREKAERLEAQDMVSQTLRAMTEGSLSEQQRAEYEDLHDDVLALNSQLTLLKINAVDRPNIEGRKAIAIFEIYNKAFEADETRPRGAGLLDFQSEEFKIAGDFQGRMSEVMRNEISKAICQAVEGALVKGISLTEAISHIQRIGSIDVNQNFVSAMAQFKYVQMRFQLLAGTGFVLVRGYADGERTNWRHPLGATPKLIQVHENAHPNVTPVDYALTFREALTPVSIGRQDKGGVTYGNEDLPNLRAAEAANILTILTDSCPQPVPSGSAPAGTTTVSILDGRVYPEFRMVDRRARVYLLAFLKNQ
ncbi:hypothetical protein SAMN05519104_2509 [Rhizobiales bacterium GAS188]|nr:hypothetical protein SAMN05519104_2509 [Rhizobiales bacterium GAS188]